jgi:acetyl esterase/lipase
MRLRDRGQPLPAALLLVYPFAHFPNPSPEPELALNLAELPPVLRFTPASIEEMVQNYVGRITNLPPDALPGAARLDGLPPVHLLASEYDDLRPSAELLQRQLLEVGSDVSTYLALGMTHGHLNRTTSIPEVGRSLDALSEAIRARVSGKGAGLAWSPRA